MCIPIVTFKTFSSLERPSTRDGAKLLDHRLLFRFCRVSSGTTAWGVTVARRGTTIPSAATLMMMMLLLSVERRFEGIRTAVLFLASRARAMACHFLSQMLGLVPFLQQHRRVATQVNNDVGFCPDATSNLTSLFVDSVLSPLLHAPQIPADALNTSVAAMLQQNFHQR